MIADLLILIIPSDLSFSHFIQPSQILQARLPHLCITSTSRSLPLNQSRLYSLSFPPPLSKPSHQTPSSTNTSSKRWVQVNHKSWRIWKRLQTVRILLVKKGFGVLSLTQISRSTLTHFLTLSLSDESSLPHEPTFPLSHAPSVPPYNSPTPLPHSPLLSFLSPRIRSQMSSLGTRDSTTQETFYEIRQRRFRIFIERRVLTNSTNRDQPFGASNDCYF